MSHDGTGLWLEFPLAARVAGQVAGQVAAQVAGQVAGQVAAQVGHEVLLLLVALEGELSRNELQQRLGLVGRANFGVRYLKPAIQLGLVALTIPDKPNSRLQKYRLTAAGLAPRAPRKTP